HAYAHIHTCGDGHAYAHIHTCSDGHAYADIHTDGHTYADGKPDGNGHTDAVHGKMSTDAKAASDCGATSHARRGGSRHAHPRSYTERHARGSYSCSR